jgi:DNA repair photolyase
MVVSKEMAIRFKRKTPENWKEEEVRNIQLKKKFSKHSGTFMYPSSHDIHPEHLEENIQYLEHLLEPGNKVLIVTKPHLECITEICGKFNNYKQKILFRFTIGSSNSEILKFWEPGAPDFKERLESVKYAYNNNFNTSISCEPMLDNNIEDLIQIILPFVTDAIWLGKANFLLRRLKLNGINDFETIKRATQLIEWQKDENILILYKKYKLNNKIKWKESIKKIVGIELPLIKGLDV